MKLIKHTIYCVCLSVVFLPITVFSAEDTSIIINIRTLSQTITTKIVTTAVSDCNKRGYKVSAALVGRDGNLLAFARNPLSGPHTIKVSQRKAYSAATFQAATADMKTREDLNFAPGILLIPGGIPIDVGGHFYGGAAVAGAIPDIDIKCIQAGVNAAIEDIQFAD